MGDKERENARALVWEFVFGLQLRALSLFRLPTHTLAATPQRATAVVFVCQTPHVTHLL